MTDHIKEALDRFRNHFVEHQAAGDILKSIERHRKYGFKEDGAECIMIVGPSRSGKTTIIKQHIRMAGRRSAPSKQRDGLHVNTLPTLFVDVPPNPRFKGLPEVMLSELGDPNPSKGTQAQMTNRVINLLKMREVGLIVLDESQHLIDQSLKTPKFRYEVGDWVKNLLNRAVCPIVLAGTKPAEAIIRANEQLRGRCTAVHRLSPFGYTTTKERNAFRLMLHHLEEAMELPKSSGLADADLAARIYVASRGLLGHMHSLLDSALRRALEEKKPKITKEMLSDVYAERMTRNNGINPFRVAEVPELHPGEVADDGDDEIA